MSEQFTMSSQQASVGVTGNKTIGTPAGISVDGMCFCAAAQIQKQLPGLLPEVCRKPPATWKPAPESKPGPVRSLFNANLPLSANIEMP